MPVATDTNGLVEYFINEYGAGASELQIPVAGSKKLSPTIEKKIREAVKEKKWQVWKFDSKKCQRSKGFRHFVIIRKPESTSTPTRDN